MLSISQLLGISRGGGLRARLLRGGAGSVVVKVTATGLSFAVAVILARSLGPGEYGVYAYVLSIVSLLTVPAQFGLPALVVRETAMAHATQQWSLMRGIWRWAGSAAGATSVALAVAAGAIAWFFAGKLSDVELATLFWSLPLVPLIALGNLRGAALRGVGRVVAGQLPEYVLRPALIVVLFGGLLYVARVEMPTADNAMAIHALAAAAAFAVGAAMLRRYRPRELESAVGAVYRHRRWALTALPLGLIASSQLTSGHLDVLVLGFFLTSEDIGVYKVASQMAALVSFPIAALNLVIAPFVSRFHALGDHERMQRLIARSAVASLLGAVPIAVAAIVFGGALLEHVFGESFVAGYLPLVILSVGQLFVAACGSLVTLASMTGHEKQTAGIMALGVVINLVLNMSLVPFFGTIGAALATVASIVLWRSLLLAAVRSWLGINASGIRSAIFS